MGDTTQTHLQKLWKQLHRPPQGSRAAFSVPWTENLSCSGPALFPSRMLLPPASILYVLYQIPGPRKIRRILQAGRSLETGQVSGLRSSKLHSFQDNCDLRGLNLGWKAKNASSPHTPNPVEGEEVPLILLPDSSSATDSSRTTRTPALYFPKHTPFSRKSHLPKQVPLQRAYSLPPIGVRH